MRINSAAKATFNDAFGELKRIFSPSIPGTQGYVAVAFSSAGMTPGI